MFFQGVLLNELNTVTAFQYFFETLMNAYKRRSLSESFFVDN